MEFFFRFHLFFMPMNLLLDWHTRSWAGYLGKNIGPSGTPTTEFDFDSIGGFTGGVFVG